MLGVVLGQNDCPALEVGGVEDHVHLSFGLSRTVAVAKVVEAVKTSSSKWIKTKGPEFAGFHWQGGYGAFSVGQAGGDAVVRSIRDQETHHRRVTFQEELRRSLERYQVAYDERYLGSKTTLREYRYRQAPNPIPPFQGFWVSLRPPSARWAGLRYDAPMALGTRTEDSFPYQAPCPGRAPSRAPTGRQSLTGVVISETIQNFDAHQPQVRLR